MNYAAYIDRFSAVLKDAKLTDNAGQELDLDTSFGAIVDALLTVKSNGRVYLVGNGGSSGIVSHSAVDFVNACGFKGQALTDNSMLTCMANDYGYENVFAQPLGTLFGAEDALIAVSSSGNSANIVNAANLCKNKGGLVITLSGFSSENKLRPEGDFNFWLDANDYGIVEIGHSLLLHHLTDLLIPHKGK